MKIQKFNRDYFEYLIPQRTRLKTEYSLTNESSDEVINEALTKMLKVDYDMISNYLPTEASSILDIGCGLGLIDLAIYKHYEDNCKLYLLDKTNSIEEGTSVRGFNQKYIFYNSLESTRVTLTDNGVASEDVNTFEVSDEAVAELSNQQYDVILSLLSCGWHYPLETYVELIQKTLKPDGVLILDIRHDTGQLEYAKEHFELVETIINTAESKHTGGTVGDRYIFRKK